MTRFTSNQESAFLIENQPSRFQCILTWDQGDNVDLNNTKITWRGPNPVNDEDINFTGHNANANITVEKGKTAHEPIIGNINFFINFEV